MAGTLKKISGKELAVVTAVADRNVLVDFSASWCGPCRMLHPQLEQLAAEMTGWDFYEIDVDEAQDEAGRLGIRSVPTMIAYSGGREVERLVGFRDKASLKGQLSGLTGS